MRNVREFGAAGDGVTNDTAAIQRAIDAGGTVLFPPGIYRSGTIYLGNGSGLYLEAGAVLLASSNPDDYNTDDFCPQNRVFTREKVSGAHFIVAVERSNIHLSGHGRIDGNAREIFAGMELNPDDPKFLTRPSWRPGQMIFFCECNNVTIENVELIDSPYWSCFLLGCEEVVVRDIRIRNNMQVRNSDGLDIDCCRMVTVSDCIISGGDDCITLRGNVSRLKTPRACEMITVSNCVLQSATCAIRVGVGEGIIRNCRFSNLIIHGSRTGICFCSSFSGNIFTAIENIDIEGVNFEGQSLLWAVNDWTGNFEHTNWKPVQDLSIRSVRARVKEPVFILGNLNHGISRLQLHDIELIVMEQSPSDVNEKLPAAELWRQRGRNVLPVALYVSGVKELALSKFKVKWMNSKPLCRYGALFFDAPGLELDQCRFQREILVNGEELPG